MRTLLIIFLFFNSLLALELTPLEKQFIEDNPVIKVSNEDDWPPFDFNEDGQAKGYSIDYLKLLAKKIGIELQFETGKWSSLIQKVQTKEIDVVHPLAKNAKREEFLLYTNPHLDLNFSIVTRTQENHIKTLEDLTGKTLAVIKGWNSTRFLEKYYPKIQFKYYKDNEEKFEAVAFGEADATIDGYFTVNYMIQRHMLSNLKISGKVTDERLNQDLYIAVRKDWPIFRDILQKAMNSVTSEEMLALNIKWIKVQALENNRVIYSEAEKAYINKKKKINMCIDPDWMPYEKDDNGKHIGMSSDYFKLFRKLIPLEIDYVPTSSWSDTLSYAKDRRCDIISLAVDTPLRREYLNFTSPYLKLPLVIATKPKEPFISDVNDILNKRIGVVKGHAYIEILKEKYPAIKLVEVASIKEGFTKVLNDEIYGFLDSLASVGYDIQRAYLGNIKIAGKLDIELSIGVATRNDEPQLLSIFEKAVNSLTPKADRTILNKWVAVKYEERYDKESIFQVLIIVLVIALFFAYRQYLLKRQNAVLQESNEEFEHLINSTIEAIFILENGRCIDVNYEGVKLLGAKDRNEIIGLHALDVMADEYKEVVKNNLQKSVIAPYEANIVKMDGSILPVLIKGHNFKLRNRMVRVTAMFDMSELKSKERLLLEQTKMAALGEMLGNIAHQWRQPLSVISTAASGMKLQKSYGMLNDEVFEEHNEAIMTNVEYLSKTIDDFKNFIKANKTPEEFNLNDHIQKDISILSPMLKSNHIEVISDVDEKFTLNNLENELTQAVVNIISNAKDAFVENGIQKRFIFINAVKDKNRLVLSIKDNAGGIPSEVINRVFEPYFTTKHKSQGTGLGLYMTHQIIVDSMNGSIDVSNESYEYEGEVYKGANFRLTL